ncbi:hypothetical protein [Paenibacillus sp. FSL H3-0333]|uniref:hypothetical protein n=1 Tax=Paenibacillus sp. FSL H3-0333 TaxID=2921373 RepID=UPI0030FD1649
MNDALMERLQLFLTKEGNQSLLGTPATEEQIAEAEKQLGLSLDQDMFNSSEALAAPMPDYPYTPSATVPPSGGRV